MPDYTPKEAQAKLRELRKKGRNCTPQEKRFLANLEKTADLIEGDGWITTARDHGGPSPKKKGFLSW